MSAIGPELPPHLLAKRKRKQEQEAENTSNEASSAYGSSMSPGAEKKRRVEGPATTTESANSKDERINSKIVGPTMPPGLLKEELHPSDAELSESEDGDDFGPALPSDNLVAGTNAIKEDGDSRASTSPAPAAKKPERDEWMMIPPKQNDISARMDPSKIRARGFNTSKGANGPIDKNGDNSSWFETPEQKQKRLQEEMMGFTRPASSALQSSSRRGLPAKDEAAAARRKDEVEKSRGPSLMEQHKQSKGALAEDDPSQRAFDREKDMASGMRISSTQRSELLKSSSTFSSKFSGGRYL